MFSFSGYSEVVKVGIAVVGCTLAGVQPALGQGGGSLFAPPSGFEAFQSELGISVPDLALAVGPDHLVAATNQDIAVFGKACIPTCLPLWSERFLGLNGFWDESVLGLGLFPDGQDPLCVL